MDFMMEKTDEGRRVGRLVISRCGVSTSGYARLKQKDGVLLNGVVAHANQRVHEGDVLTIVHESVPYEGSLRPVSLTIAYEDNNILIVDKPAPLPTMASRHQQGDSLEHQVTEYLGSFRPVNRLDKGTSGLMVIAKNAYAQNILQKALHTDMFVREYLVIVTGIMQKNSGEINLPISHGKGVLRVIDKNGKPSRTDYIVLKRTDDNTLVSARLLTGRTHQIRVHFSALGHPVVGDYLYGTQSDLLPGRIALHSAHLFLSCPLLLKEPLDLMSPLPKELSDLIS